MGLAATKAYTGRIMDMQSRLEIATRNLILLGSLLYAATSFSAEITLPPSTGTPVTTAEPSAKRITSDIVESSVALIPQPSPSSKETLVFQNDAEGQSNAKTHAMAAAVADGVSTGLALSAGGLEANPLLSTSPLGLVAVTGIKLGLVNYADTLPQPEKRLTLKSTSSVWGGAAVNNIMIFLAAPPPFPIFAGLLAGLLTWHHLENQYEKEDLLLAAKNSSIMNVQQVVTPKLADVNETSGK